MGLIAGNVRENLLAVFKGVYEKDAAKVLDALIALGVVRGGNADRLALTRCGQGWEMRGEQLRMRLSPHPLRPTPHPPPLAARTHPSHPSRDPCSTISYFIDNLTRKTERSEAIGAIGEDLFAIALQQPIRFPATFTFVLRAFATLEGIGTLLDPSYKFSEVATPFAQELLDLGGVNSGSFLVQQLQQQAREVAQAAAQAPQRIQYVESTIRQCASASSLPRRAPLPSSRTATAQDGAGRAQAARARARGRACGAATTGAAGSDVVDGRAFWVTAAGFQPRDGRPGVPVMGGVCGRTGVRSCARAQAAASEDTGYVRAEPQAVTPAETQAVAKCKAQSGT